MTTYLRNQKTGVIFPDVPVLAAQADMKRVTEQEAFPERYAPVNLEEYAPKVELKVAEHTVEPLTDPSPELTQEASRRPFKRGTRGVNAAPTAQTPAAPSFSGLLEG